MRCSCALILQVVMNGGPRAREATRGYFADLSATRRHGGKTWIAPKVMIREDVSFLLSLVFTISMLSRYFKITTDEFIDVLIGDDHALRT